MAGLTKIRLIFCLLFLAGFRAFLPAQDTHWSSRNYARVSTEAPSSKATAVAASLNAAAEERDQLDNLPDLLAHYPVPFGLGGSPAVNAGLLAQRLPGGKRAGPPVPFYLLFCSLRIPLP